MSRIYWTPAEDDRLAAGAAAGLTAGLTAEEIAAEISSGPHARTPGAVRQRGGDLGITGPNFRAATERWGDEDLKALLRLRRQGLTFPEIGAHLGRSAMACQCKWHTCDEALAQRRKPRAEPAAAPRLNPARRRCLRCRSEFDSSWCGNRICDGCRAAVSGVSAQMTGANCGGRTGAVKT